MKKYFNLLSVLLVTMSFQSISCYQSLLVDLSTRFLKGLPEFIGYDKSKGMTNEMKAFYPSYQAWGSNAYTLKSNELSCAFDNFVAGFRNDTQYNNPGAWANKASPPQSLFNTSKNPPEIAYPYIQKVVVPAGSTILFIGDMHASPHSFLRTLWRWFLRGFIDSNLKLKKDYYFVTSGDYVDFGNGGSELWYLLVMLKLNNWNQVFMLRGNHEFWSWSVDNILSLSTFINELDFKFGGIETAQLKNKIRHAYNLLPSALLIGTENNYIVCAHGRADPTYNAMNLLQQGNFYDYLSAPHNFAYDGTKHGGSSNNIFINGLYSNDPSTKPIETDIKALRTQYSYMQKTTHIIVRGHQHSTIPECFCFVVDGYPVGTNPNTTVLPGWQAEHNVRPEDQCALINGCFNINDLLYYPIYTLFSAIGNTTRFDCFSKIRTDEEFCQWRFKVYQRDLNTNETYLRNFARLELCQCIHRNDIRTVYANDQKPFNDPLSEELIRLAEA